MTDVCLVSMPYGTLERPALGISLLAAAARRAGLKTAVLYETFSFAERVGLRNYHCIARQFLTMLGEWTFAGSAFPEFRPNHKDYFQLIAEHLERCQFGHSANYPAGTPEGLSPEEAWQIRREAAGFVAFAAEEILSCEPKIVGCTCQVQQFVSSLALLRKIKELRPEVLTMLGGSCCDGTQAFTTVEAFPWIDVVVSGEADQVFVPLCQTLLTHGTRADQELLPKSVAVRGRRSNPMDGLAREAEIESVEDLDLIPIPDLSDYFQRLQQFSHREQITTTLMIESSRGCWWQNRTGGCTFCAVSPGRRRYRVKSGKRFVSELLELYDCYGVNVFMASDDILSPLYFETVFPNLCERGMPPLLMFWEVKGNITETQMAILGAAGVRWIQVGIESLHDELLRLMGKGVSALGNIRMLKWAREQGVRISWHMLHGIPGEREIWYREMTNLLPLVQHLEPPDCLVQLHFDRHSPYFCRPGEFGLRLIPQRAYRFTLPLNPAQLQAFASFFEDQQLIQDGYPIAPAVVYLKRAIEQWRSVFPVDRDAVNLPELVEVVDGEESYIMDTRPNVGNNAVVLKGLEHFVHLHCRNPTSMVTLRQVAALHNFQVTSAKIEHAVAALAEKKLIICCGERLISLATRRPKRPLVNMDAIRRHLEHYQVDDHTLIPAAV